jgi:AcrR family transcriptional regulator
MLAVHGLSATVDEIAASAGVSPRTIFRHFNTHDQLIADAVQQMYRDLWQPVEGLPDPDADLEGFISTLATMSHTRNSRMLGRAFWDLMSPRADTPPAIAEGLAARGESRRKWMGRITEQAWRSAGGVGAPPDPVVEAFWLHFSAFAAASYAADFHHTPEEAAESTTAILLALLRGAVAAQRAEG